MVELEEGPMYYMVCGHDGYNCPDSSVGMFFTREEANKAKLDAESIFEIIQNRGGCFVDKVLRSCDEFHKQFVILELKTVKNPDKKDEVENG